MQRLVVLLAWLVAGCACKPPPEAPEPRDQFIARLTNNTYQVQIDCPGRSGSGSAVALLNRDGYTYFATAYHVVDEEDCTFSVNSRESEVLAFDEDYDAAIIRVRPAFRVVPVARAYTYIGMRVTSVGYPSQPWTGRTSLQVTSGELSALIPLRYKISSPVFYGSSGGPVFDDSGNLVGLVTNLIQKGGVPLPGEWFASPA